MTLQQAVVLALQVSILMTVLGFGLRTTVSDVMDLVRRPSLVLRSLLAMFVIMPIVAVALAQAFELRPSVEIALVALAIAIRQSRWRLRKPTSRTSRTLAQPSFCICSSAC